MKNNTAIATTATAETSARRRYSGRFAPSPTGDLHLGSLYTATASYLDARAAGGRWLVRLEDLDRARVVAGSADGILRTLHAFGFEWDGEVVRQSERSALYSGALETLRAGGLTFECSCSRSELEDDVRYPGHCRVAPRFADGRTATRLRVEPGHVQFKDRIQGAFRQDVAAAVGDVVLRRRDQVFAYLLAVVIDDDAQGVTHIVRGADLLDNTPRQILLQRLLGMESPTYSHVPVLLEADGRKLAKSIRSVRLDVTGVVAQLVNVFTLLGLSPPDELRTAAVHDVWAWAIDRWPGNTLSRRLSQPLPA